VRIHRCQILKADLNRNNATVLIEVTSSPDYTRFTRNVSLVVHMNMRLMVCPAILLLLCISSSADDKKKQPEERGQGTRRRIVAESPRIQMSGKATTQAFEPNLDATFG